MLLTSLLLTPILGVVAILVNRENGSSLTNIKIIALSTSIINFFISLVIFILFDFSTNQFQFVQEYHEISYFDFYLGLDGLSIYFVLFMLSSLKVHPRQEVRLDRHVARTFCKYHQGHAITVKTRGSYTSGALYILR